LDYPCGFCGQASANGKCSTDTVRSGKAQSTCPHVYNFMISPASRISIQKPCTNVPIQCRLCVQVHWKYNISHHLHEQHPSWEQTLSLKDLEEFRSKISISSEEETKLGIPEDLHGRYATVVTTAAYDARRMAITLDRHGDSPRRARQSTPQPTYSLPIPFNLVPNPNPHVPSTNIPHFNDVFANTHVQ